MANRKAPMARLMQKLGLTGFRNVGPLEPEPARRRARSASSSSSTSATPCEPAVAVGQRVTKGQVVGRPPVRDGKPALGVPVHASIDGTVSSIRDGIVWLERTSP